MLKRDEDFEEEKNEVKGLFLKSFFEKDHKDLLDFMKEKHIATNIRGILENFFDDVCFYGEEQTLDQIPEAYYDFTQTVGNFFGLEEADKLTLEYTNDNKKFTLLNNDNYNDFFLNGTKDVNIYNIILRLFF